MIDDLLDTGIMSFLKWCYSSVRLRPVSLRMVTVSAEFYDYDDTLRTSYPFSNKQHQQFRSSNVFFRRSYIHRTGTPFNPGIGSASWRVGDKGISDSSSIGDVGERSGLFSPSIRSVVAICRKKATLSSSLQF